MSDTNRCRPGRNSANQLTNRQIREGAAGLPAGTAELNKDVAGQLYEMPGHRSNAAYSGRAFKTLAIVAVATRSRRGADVSEIMTLRRVVLQRTSQRRP